MTMLLSTVGTSSKGLWLPYSCREAERPAPTVHARKTGELSPRMRLSDFFVEWFTPNVLMAGDEPAAIGTLNLYAQAMSWWNKLTGDPLVCEITDNTVERFRLDLRAGTFQRGPNSPHYPLSKVTQKKHLAHVGSVLYRLGPTSDRKRRTAKLIPEHLFFKIPNAPTERKEPFCLERARAIAAAAERMPAPTNPLAFWRCYVALHFYTGLRSGTIKQLRREHVFEKAGQLWLDVPAELVSKTGKGTKIPLHGKLIEALEPYRDSPTLLPETYCGRYLLELHGQLQTLAGVPEGEQMSPHAWRRTHACELATLGLSSAMTIAQVALNHSDKKTTEDHYCNIRDQLILQLPDLW